MTTNVTPDNLTICTASRLSEAEFFERAWFARSLILSQGRQPLRLELIADNQPPNAVKGLAEAYNDVLDRVEDDFLVFVHDDVYVHDWFLMDRLTDAFERFDVVGVAGNAAPDFAQPSWLGEFDSDLRWLGPQEQSRLSGVVSHGQPARPNLTVFGPTPRECQLLDGLFLAVDVQRVREARVRFDTRFTFHCYDTDFCRSAREAGLRLGTWPIALTHASEGWFEGPSWREEAELYLEKWC